jgi:hypothetical protein
VTWTYYTDVQDDDPMTQAQDRMWAANPDESVIVDIGWFGNGTDAPATTLTITGVNGWLSGSGTVSADGRVVTAEFTNPKLVGLDLQHSVDYLRGTGPDGWPEFWFDGFTPRNPDPIDPSTGGGGTAGGGAGGGDGGANADAGMTINGGDVYTNDPHVKLSVVAPAWASWLRVDNDGGFQTAKSFAAKKTIRWHLTESGRERLPKTVYLRFGSSSQTYTDDIILDQTKPTVRSATVGSGGATASAAVMATASKARTYRVRVRAKDATSGVAKVQFAVRSKRHPSALRKFKRISRYNGARAPKYVRVRDRAGNYSRWRSIR